MKKPVNSKKNFVKRYQKGEFGNKSPTWENLTELKESNFKGLVHARNRHIGGDTHYSIPSNSVLEYMEAYNLNPSDYYFSGMAPHNKHGLIQGEVTITHLGTYLRYASAKLPMREAFKGKVSEVVRIAANHILKKNLNERSFAWLCCLLEDYPNHVIEFSSFDIEWGDIPGYNTVFWEVRNY
jgi:hypothetical protein